MRTIVFTHLPSNILLILLPLLPSLRLANPTPGMPSLRVKVPDYPDARIHFRESYFSGALDSIPPEAQ